MGSCPAFLTALGLSRCTEVEAQDNPGVRLSDLRGWQLLAQSQTCGIYKCFDVRRGEEFCVKRLEKSRAKSFPGLIEDFRRESHLLLTLENPGVIGGKALLEDYGHLYLVQELGKRGDLFHLAEQFPRHRIPEAYVRDNVAKPLLGALHDLHSRGIAHRDLKPENVVITAYGEVKLCDLGLAIDTVRWPATAAVGTTEFQAPELVWKKQTSRQGRMNSVPQAYEPKAADVWSLGALLYEALCGRSPFAARSRTKVEQNVLTCRFSFPADVNLSESCKDFLRSCLHEKPSRRLSVEQLLEHEWMRLSRKPDLASSPARSQSATVLEAQPKREGPEGGQAGAADEAGPSGVARQDGGGRQRGRKGSPSSVLEVAANHENWYEDEPGLPSAATAGLKRKHKGVEFHPRTYVHATDHKGKNPIACACAYPVSTTNPNAKVNLPARRHYIQLFTFNAAHPAFL